MSRCGCSRRRCLAPRPSAPSLGPQLTVADQNTGLMARLQLSLGFPACAMALAPVAQYTTASTQSVDQRCTRSGTVRRQTGHEHSLTRYVDPHWLAGDSLRD